MNRESYEKLQEHVKAIEIILKSCEPHITEKSGKAAILESKTFGIVQTTVAKTLQEFVDKLTECSRRRQVVEDKALTYIKDAVQRAEQKFEIKPPVEPVQKYGETTISRLVFRMPIYQDVSRIPVMSYGLVQINGVRTLVFRYGETSVVSCSGLTIADSGDNQRTLSCTNTDRCEYGDQCRYFHDPLLWSRSRHVQRAPKTSIIKGYPQFGDDLLVADQVSELSFENVRSFGRYLAIMMLFVSRVADRKSADRVKFESKNMDNDKP